MSKEKKGSRAAHGFIYLMRNSSMPGIYKIGRTDRAPSQRAAELSAATGVPQLFEVLCFGEVTDPVAVEGGLHAAFDCFRVRDGREFFRVDVLDAMRAIRDEAGTFVIAEPGCDELDARGYHSISSALVEASRAINAAIAALDAVEKARAA